MWRWISPYNDIDPDSLLLRQMAGDHYRDHWQPNRLLMGKRFSIGMI